MSFANKQPSLDLHSIEGAFVQPKEDSDPIFFSVSQGNFSNVCISPGTIDFTRPSNKPVAQAVAQAEVVAQAETVEASLGGIDCELHFQSAVHFCGLYYVIAVCCSAGCLLLAACLLLAC